MRTVFYSFAPLAEQSINSGDSGARRMLAVYQSMLSAFAELLEKYEAAGFNGYNVTDGHDGLRSLVMSWRMLPSLLETAFFTMTEPQQVG